MAEQQLADVERRLTLPEAVLAHLRDQAIDTLLTEGRSLTLNSVGRKNGDVLTIETTGDGQRRVVNVTGEVTGDDRIFNPMASGWSLPNPGSYVTGEFTFTDQNNRLLERSRINFYGSHVDSAYSRPDKATISILRTDGEGNVLQRYEPAQSYIKMENGRIVYDQGGQPVRLAKPTGGGPNCGLENPGNPGNRRRDCEYILHDPELGELSYNQTQSTEQMINYRSVVRRDGDVVGIVEQTFQVDEDGDVLNVTTSARKPVWKK